MIYSVGQPYCMLLPLSAVPIELGRGMGLLPAHTDSLMSRRHARVAVQDGMFFVEDLGSRNGSAIEGLPLHGSQTVSDGALLRFGGSLFLATRDLRPYSQFGIKKIPDRISGPTQQRMLQTVEQVAGASRVLAIRGERGSGKESVALAFHQQGSSSAGPFISVNCAAVPESIAARRLFGARKGAFTGLTQDSDGYVAAADRGTLFLDEVGELDLAVQAKLLRVIETGELLPLGATRPRKVEFRVCTATHKDLRTLVQDGRFRADLYFRIGMPEVIVPPLRQRREEIPWLMQAALESTFPGLSLEPQLVEVCLLRSWPGNVRELLAETQAAALKAKASGKIRVALEHLAPMAGSALVPSGTPPVPEKVAFAAPSIDGEVAAPIAAPPAEESPVSEKNTIPRDQIVAASLQTDGNLSATARALGIHRTQLRRLLVRHGIDVDKLRRI